MISIELPADIEKRFNDVVENIYNGSIQSAITSLLKLHEKYQWKEQLIEDVKSIRSEVHRKGGISSKNIEQAIKKYRKNIGKRNIRINFLLKIFSSVICLLSSYPFILQSVNLLFFWQEFSNGVLENLF